MIAYLVLNKDRGCSQLHQVQVYVKKKEKKCLKSQNEYSFKGTKIIKKLYFFIPTF